MTGLNKTPDPNSKDEGLRSMWERLERGDRVELMNTVDLTARVEKKRENFNIVVKTNGRIVRIRSGGYEIKIDTTTNKVVVYDKNGVVHHEIDSACLVRNMTTMLFRLAKYIPEGGWITFSFDRKVPEVRRFQAWVLAVITNFSRPLKHNPLVC